MVLCETKKKEILTFTGIVAALSPTSANENVWNGFFVASFIVHGFTDSVVDYRNSDFLKHTRQRTVFV